MIIIKKNTIFLAVSILTSLFLLAGCGTFGSDYLERNHQAFNRSAREAIDAQMLLNIVRLRYTEPPYFLKVDNITAQMSRMLGGSYTYDGVNATSALAAAVKQIYFASFSHEERPTFSYQPLEGKEYTKHILQPLDFKDVYRFIASGWDIARVFRITLQTLGPLHNAYHSNRPVTSTVPKHYKSYRRATYDLSVLEDYVPLSHRLVQIDKEYYIEFTATPSLPDKLADQYGLPKGTSSFLIGPRASPHATKPILVGQTRSFIGILYYLSKGVDVPESHFNAHLARQTFDKNHVPFNWTEATKYVMHIRYSKSPPKRYLTRTYYKNYWYYIPESSDNSKQTFSFLLTLYALFGGDSKERGPVYTLPL